jgi:hypothetical protein
MKLLLQNRRVLYIDFGMALNMFVIYWKQMPEYATKISSKIVINYPGCGRNTKK